MNNKRTIALLGGSIITSTLETIFKDRSDLEIIRVDGGLSDIRKVIEDIDPEVILYDLAAVHLEDVIPLLKIKPHLLLIGINYATSQMMVLFGQTSSALTGEDLLEAVEVDFMPMVLKKEYS